MKPSMDEWLNEAKNSPDGKKCGMFLVHNGAVRETSKAQVRFGDTNAEAVTGMSFDYDAELVEEAIQNAYRLPGIYYIRTWLNKGELAVGEDIMFVLIGGDIRPHVTDALNYLVGEIKNKCVKEIEKH